MASNTRASLSAVLSMNNSKFKKGLKGAKTQMTGFSRSINAIGKSLVPFIGITAGVAGLTRVMRGAFRTIAGFEQAMADVKAVTRASEEDFKKLSDAARKLGGSTKFTAIEVAKLSKELGKLGFSTDEILAAEGAILDLAAATNTELARAAEVVGITIRQFGLQASESKRVVDLMAGSFSRSALDTEKFAESMKLVGPVARKAGVSLEETTALLSILADSGISASMAGTGLRKIISELAGEGENLSERFEELAKRGLNLADAEDEVGLRAKTALLVILEQIDVIPKLTEEYDNLADSAETMANVQLNTLTGQLTILKSAYDGLITTAGSTEEGMNKTKKAIGGAAAGIQLVTGIVDEGTTKWQRYAFQAAPVITSFIMLKKEANETEKALETYFEGTEAAAKAAEKLAEKERLAAEEAAELAEKERLATIEALRLKQALDAVKDPLKIEDAFEFAEFDLEGFDDFFTSTMDWTDKLVAGVMESWQDMDFSFMFDKEAEETLELQEEFLKNYFRGLARKERAEEQAAQASRDLNNMIANSFLNVASTAATSLGQVISGTKSLGDALKEIGSMIFNALGDILIYVGMGMGPAGIPFILAGLGMKMIGGIVSGIDTSGGGGTGKPAWMSPGAYVPTKKELSIIRGNDIRAANEYYTNLYNRVG